MQTTKHTVAVDWLEFMLAGSLVCYDQPLDSYQYGNGRYKLIRKPLGNRFFKYNYEVWTKGRHLATLYCEPRTPEIIAPDTINLKLENARLYEMGWLDEIKSLFAVTKWSVKNVTRLDIAIDGVNAIEIGKKFGEGTVELKGRAKMAMYFDSKGRVEGYDCGRRSSDLWFTVYNKSRELETSNKTYISDFWKQSGLASDNVERWEIKMRNEAIKLIKGFSWELLDDFEYLASICRTKAERNFFFYYVNNDSNVSRKKSIEFCDWDCIGAKLLDALSIRKTTELYSLKRTAKMLFWLYLSSGDVVYRNKTWEIVVNINCIDWYQRKVDGWKKEYEKKYVDAETGETQFEYLSIYKTYDSSHQLALFVDDIETQFENVKK